MKKYGKIDAPPDAVRQIFADADGWPEWMPGIESARVTGGDDDQMIVETTQRHFGRRLHQVLECRLSSDGMDQRQLSGWARQWRARWRFLPSPDGSGTTVACELLVEFGMMGLFIPGRTIQRHLDATFERIIERGQLRVRAVAEETAAPTEEIEALLQVFEADGGLEVWINGKRYRLQPLD